MNSNKLGWTGERFLPEVEGDISLEHIHRYLFAAEYADNKDVLDIASGEGYGAALLADVAKSVCGVDISMEAIIHSQEQYVKDNLSFKVGACERIPLDDNSVDLVVSFETIEHHDKHAEMMMEIKRVLRSDGVVVISSPDKHVFTEVMGLTTHYHVKELYRREFESLISTYFSDYYFYGQKVQYGSAIFSESTGCSTKTYLKKDESYIGVDGLELPVYIVAVASDKPLHKMKQGLLEVPVWEASYVNELSKKLLQERDTALEEKDNAVQERDTALEEKDNAVQERDEALHAKRLEEVNNQKLLDSTSWRITAPFRVVRRLVFGTHKGYFNQLFLNGATKVWRKIPGHKKTKIKGLLFKAMPLLFSKTTAYNNWLIVSVGKPTQVPNVEQVVISSLNNPVEIQAEGVSYVDRLDGSVDSLVKLIAFYLPQFHAIPENDAWWGDGFTEWTNVKPANAQFKGHYQPHVPGDLGYYDLTDVNVQRQQVELAKQYGLGGFCFYFYWFAGTRLLEAPIKQFFDTKDIDFPYCLCWANENWSRTWDGLDNDILIEQKHSKEDDLAFIEYISEYLQDERYIRVEGKPLLIVYRPSLLPNAKKTTDRWRQRCRDNGVGEIYLASTLSFDTGDPRVHGFDVAIEFPPNNMSPRMANEQIESNGSEFSGAVYDWTDLADRSEVYEKPSFPTIRSVCPSWDNTARKKERGTVFVGSTPERYGRWLHNAINETKLHSTSKDQLVFVNAWNEWAEGAHLEPDQRYGYAYLEATRQALNGGNFDSRRTIVLVAHDAHPHGAQNLILHMAKSLKEELGYVVHMVVLGGGPLLSEYEKYATLQCLSEDNHEGDEADAIAEILWQKGCREAICNTVVTGLFAGVLNRRGFKIVSLVHEMPQVIMDNKLEPHCRKLAASSGKIVFPASVVLEGFSQFVNVEPKKIEIKPQGLFRRNKYAGNNGRIAAKEDLASRWSVPVDAKCVVAVGYADKRKGVDLYVDMAIQLLKQGSNTFFVWVGHFDEDMEGAIKLKVQESGYQQHFIFPGLDFDSDIYYAAADVYALTSREDPFPCVVLEALGVATPVVAFKGAGGFDELLSRAGGVLAKAFDVNDFACCVKKLLDDEALSTELGAEGRALMEDEFSFSHYLFDLLEWTGKPLRKVTVIVPNYNYGDHMAARIKSILDQDYPIYELIVLDDASTDNSIEQIKDLLAESTVVSKLVVNDVNSGSPFVQWKKGIELASGDYIWIAEADDLTASSFLSELIRKFDNPLVVLSYCESQQIDENDHVIADNYEGYLADISTSKWKRDYVIAGHKELSTAMVVKNTVPNVSAVVFRRKQMIVAFNSYAKEILGYRFAGDWMMYVALLASDGALAYSCKSLNKHRRHVSSVTQQSYGKDHLNEIISMQNYIIENFDISESDVKKVHSYRASLARQFSVEVQ